MTELKFDKVPTAPKKVDPTPSSIQLLDLREYVAKPLRVMAVEVTAENMMEVARWCDGAIIFPKKSDVAPLFVTRARDIIVPVEELRACHIRVPVQRPQNDRQTQANVGDFVVKVKSGFKVYSGKTFPASFDPKQVAPERYDELSTTLSVTEGDTPIFDQLTANPPTGE